MLLGMIFKMFLTCVLVWFPICFGMFLVSSLVCVFYLFFDSCGTCFGMVPISCWYVFDISFDVFLE